MEYSGNGYIKIRVTTVGGTVPASGAAVIISEHTDSGNSETLYTLRTGRNGVTPTVMLPAPRSSESQTPGAVQPYGLYDIRVTRDGYLPVELTTVPIFDRVTSIQSVDLLPADIGDMYPDEVRERTEINEQANGGYLAPSGVGGVGDFDEYGGRGRGDADSASEGGGI